ncbi:MAG: glycoside hydrolase family 99-like domain-containing protein, partial [Roseibacillus sp.]|nr:glycoside hydrolase family 99-like domain-containing protein [Roseibacillus sp.]
EGGRTFGRTLALAWQSSCELIQIVTWNDYGEGTAIEPTEEFGYRYLEKLQRRIAAGSEFAYSAEDLHLPVFLYKLRKQHSGKGAIAPLLTQASRLLFASRTEEARTVLMQLRKQKQ